MKGIVVKNTSLLHLRGIFLFASKIKYNEDMEIDMNKEHWSNGPCPKFDCRKNACKCGLRYVEIAAVLGDDSKTSDVAPKNGAYCNSIVKYEANGAVYIYSTEGIPVKIKEGEA